MQQLLNEDFVRENSKKYLLLRGITQPEEWEQQEGKKLRVPEEKIEYDNGFSKYAKLGGLLKESKKRREKKEKKSEEDQVEWIMVGRGLVF